jgi:hypothetical protein
VGDRFGIDKTLWLGSAAKYRQGTLKDIKGVGNLGPTIKVL